MPSDRRPYLFGSLFALALAAVSCSGGGGKVETSAASADTAATVEHGAYVATITGCHDCHTPGTLFGVPDFQRALSGSELGWQGPWGTTFPRNLTPDQETGIGKWSEDEIIQTLRTGKRPDGSDLKAPMPWPYTASMTPRDIRSLAMYLKSLPPVHHVNLEAIPPGQKVTGSIIVMPSPSAWDVPKPK
jgi:mono/diheme cytochrome c family protein